MRITNQTYRRLLLWSANLGRRPAGLAAGMRVELDAGMVPMLRYVLLLVRPDGSKEWIEECEDKRQAENVVWLLNRALARTNFRTVKARA